jgi:hypothetical protein
VTADGSSVMEGKILIAAADLFLFHPGGQGSGKLFFCHNQCPLFLLLYQQSAMYAIKMRAVRDRPHPISDVQ